MGYDGWNMGQNIWHFRELEVYQMAFEAAMRIFDLTKNFPIEERIADRSDTPLISLSPAILAEPSRKR